MEPTYTRLHQTAAIGENSKRRFLRDMAGVHWGSPCFGDQGGPQQTTAILPAKPKFRIVTLRQNGAVDKVAVFRKMQVSMKKRHLAASTHMLHHPFEVQGLGGKEAVILCCL